jgi:hypothetical protein
MIQPFGQIQSRVLLEFSIDSTSLLSIYNRDHLSLFVSLLPFSGIKEDSVKNVKDLNEVRHVIQMRR